MEENTLSKLERTERSKVYFVLTFLVVAVVTIGGAFLFLRNGESSDSVSLGGNQVRITAGARQNSNLEGDIENEKVLGSKDEVSNSLMDQENILTVNVEARNFYFSPNEIRVKKGQEVRIILSSKEGFHDFVVDEINIKTNAVAEGETSELTFVANETGSFEFYCSIGNHRQLGMVGTIIVEE